MGSIPTRPRQILTLQNPVNREVSNQVRHMLNKYNILRICLFSLILLFSLSLFSGCVSSTLLLETSVNDPIMMNLLDNDADLAQIEDGTGSVGEAATCPT
ncbi:hypothetical protein BVY01_05000 [bacterium I07]|nr:hypothetical protein BVY01_05000 [bacterium I07]